MTDQNSLFRLVSFAYAAENKALDSEYLEVVPIEINPFLNGDVLPNPTDLNSTGKDSQNNEYMVKVTSANSIKAKWLQWGSNRATPPDVMRGERILLYQYESTDNYYWISPGLDDHLRRLETVIYLYSATPAVNVDKRTPENCYCLEVSTHQKTITLSTSKANGEPYAYIAQINANEGTVTIADDSDNFIQLDSDERSIALTNQDQSLVKIDKKSIYLKAADLISAKTKQFALEAEQIFLKATKMTVQVGQTTWNGNIVQVGNFGNTGTMINNGKSVGNDHRHTTTTSGNPTSPVI